MRRLLTERYRERLAGVLSCYDRIIVTGTYRYYLTRAGRAAIAAGRRLAEHTIIPVLA